MVRESISKMKNGNTAGRPGVILLMVKTTGEAGVDMITGQVNQTIAKEAVST